MQLKKRRRCRKVFASCNGWVTSTHPFKQKPRRSGASRFRAVMKPPGPRSRRPDKLNRHKSARQAAILSPSPHGSGALGARYPGRAGRSALGRMTPRADKFRHAKARGAGAYRTRPARAPKPGMGLTRRQAGAVADRPIPGRSSRRRRGKPPPCRARAAARRRAAAGLPPGAGLGLCRPTPSSRRTGRSKSSAAANARGRCTRCTPRLRSCSGSSSTSDE